VNPVAGYSTFSRLLSASRLPSTSVIGVIR
jgi:hypothetical protein